VSGGNIRAVTLAADESFVNASPAVRGSAAHKLGRRSHRERLRRPCYFVVGKPMKQRYFVFPAVFFAEVAFAFGDRLAVAFVVGLALGVAPVFLGDCFAVVLVPVVFAPVFFGAVFFVAACFVAILVAPVMSGVSSMIAAPRHPARSNSVNPRKVDCHFTSVR
jgi:hypothetical protein